MGGRTIWLGFAAALLACGSSSSTKMHDAAAIDAAVDAKVDTPAAVTERIAFTSNRAGAQYDIYVLDVAGGQVTNVTNNAAGDVDPSWSPDGTKIAFASDRGGNQDMTRTARTRST